MAKTSKYFIIYKPFKVLSQFSNENGNPGLGSLYELPKDVYPVGRLDLDSEGLLILTNDKSLNNKLLNPKYKHWRTYLTEVEGIPDAKTLARLSDGIDINLKGNVHHTQKAKARLCDPDPSVQDRVPPVNYKKHPLRSWLEISLTEGKNRQVRKMTAAVGHPTLRLLRVRIEALELFPLKSGEIRQLSKNVIYEKLNLL